MQAERSEPPGGLTRGIFYLFVALSIVPLSVFLETGEINFIRLFSPPTVFKFQFTSITMSHFALALAGLFILPAFFIRQLWHLRLTFHDLLLVLIFALMSLSLAAGFLAEPDRVSVLGWAKSVLFIFAFFIGRALPLALLPRIVSLMILVNTAFLGFILLFGLASGYYTLTSPLAYTRIVSSAILEYRNLYPLVAYGVFVLSVLFYGFYPRGFMKRIIWLHGALILWLLSVSWSRTALMVLVLMLLFSSFAFFILRPGIDRVLQALLLVFVTLGLVLVAGLLPESVFANISILSRLAEGTDQGDGNRLSYMSEGIRRLMESPLFGEKYLPDIEISPTGDLYEHPRMFTPHNQYIDIGLKGGVGAMIMIIWLHVSMTLKSLILASRTNTAFARTFLVFIYALAMGLFPGNFGQNYFIQSASSFFIWFLFGVGTTYMAGIKRGTP